ncbi:MAG TPA: sensor histidine kinase, partial [Lachnospiraceae bacterium]|nr:sensor histidine kinase [Lachnospiraceae bacterium]
IIVSFISVTVSVLTVYSISKKTVQNQYIKLAEDNLAAFDIVVDKDLETLIGTIRNYILDDKIISTISKEPQTQNGHYFDSGSRTQLFDQVSEMFNQLSMVEGVFIFDNYDRYYMYLKNGKNTSAYLNYYNVGIDKDSDWYRAMMETRGKEIFWNGDVLNPDNQDCFTIIKKLNDTTKYDPVGVVVITVRKTFLKEIYSELNTQNIVLLLDESDNYITQIGTSNSTDDFFEAYKKEKYEDDGDYLYLERINTTTGWKFITGIRKNKLYEENIYIRSYIEILLLIVVGAVFLVSILVTNRIYKPLRKLEEAVEEINCGKRQIETEFDDSEIGTIGQTIKRVVNNNLYLEKQIVEIELSKKKAQFLLLQAQINPHYLYNTLDSIYILALKYKAEDIAQMVLSLSEMFKLSLNEGKGYVHVQEEINYVKNYMCVMNYRFKNRFKVFFDVDDEILDCYMLKFLLQPFVENSIIHGLEQKVGEGSVTISGMRSDGNLEFKIYDDGIGFDVENEHTTGYGIRNVIERIELVYGKGYGVKIRSTIGEGTTVIIKIPDKGHEFYYQSES